MSNTRRKYYKNSLTQKLNELAAIESQLAGTLSAVKVKYVN
jgi:hypothetical protein